MCREVNSLSIKCYYWILLDHTLHTCAGLSIVLCTYATLCNVGTVSPGQDIINKIPIQMRIIIISIDYREH